MSFVAYRPIGQQQRTTAVEFRDAPLVSFMGRDTTFGQFDRQTDRVAAFLAKRGVVKGDRVALYCINSDFFAVAYFGAVKAGATVVPINLLLSPPEVAYVINDAGAKALIFFEAFDAALQAARSAIENLPLTIRIAADGGRGGADAAWPEALACTEPAPEPSVVPEEDLAAMLYTSGTTGKPKGAMLTHRNLVSNTFSIRQALRLEPGKDVLLTVLPMFHAFAATVGMLFPVLHGCRFVPVPKFDPTAVADAIAATQATIFCGVPSMYSVLMRLPDAAVAKFASLKYCVSGGAAMPVELMKQFERKFGKLIYEGDGPTECSPVTCVNPIGGRRKPGSVGCCVPDVDMEIRDDLGRELPRNEIGEICVQGPNVMKGYWNRPEETEEAFFGSWFRTGDLGFEDDEGYFFIVDRKKDMLIVNGMNVYPRVVEEVLYQIPGVREAAVVGEPSELHGEVPVAFLSFKEGVTVPETEVRAFCRERLGRYQIPKRFHFREDLPKNAAGKILKRELGRSGEFERGVNLDPASD